MLSRNSWSLDPYLEALLEVAPPVLDGDSVGDLEDVDLAVQVDGDPHPLGLDFQHEVHLLLVIRSSSILKCKTEFGSFRPEERSRDFSDML